MARIIPLDVHWTGRSQAVAAALLESGGQHAILDPGPASTVDTLRKELSAHGLSVHDLHTILLTHIHLDHAEQPAPSSAKIQNYASTFTPKAPRTSSIPPSSSPVPVASGATTYHDCSDTPSQSLNKTS